MPRISRGLIAQSVYHIINRGNGGRAVFQKNGDYEAFVSILQEAKVRYLVKVFAYCLMPNHFHMVLMPDRAEYLSKMMQWLWVLIDEIPIELPKDWANYVDEPITEKELDKLRQSLNRQSPYGDSSWQVQMCRELGLESTLRPRGRPRGTDG
jgi:hypothetical protein